MTYCLIYLDDVIVFLKTEEEHLHHLHIVFKHFREHQLKLKPTKCEFFKSKINYLAHHVSKEGIHPSKENLKAVPEFTPSQTYTEIWTFLGLVGHYRQFIKGFICIAQPLDKNLTGEGASKKKQTSDAHGKCIGCLWYSQESLPQGPCAGFCWFQ